MRFLKINTDLSTNTGEDVTIPAGSIAKMSEIYLPVKDAADNEDVPVQIPLHVFSSEKSLTDKKSTVNEILKGTSFPLVVSAIIPYSVYGQDNLGPETVFLNAAKTELEKHYNAKVEIITI